MKQRCKICCHAWIELNQRGEPLPNVVRCDVYDELTSTSHCCDSFSVDTE